MVSLIAQFNAYDFSPASPRPGIFCKQKDCSGLAWLDAKETDRKTKINTYYFACATCGKDSIVTWNPISHPIKTVAEQDLEIKRAPKKATPPPVTSSTSDSASGTTEPGATTPPPSAPDGTAPTAQSDSPSDGPASSSATTRTAKKAAGGSRRKKVAA